MEKETRSAIESATQKARRLLETDFQEQLDGVFDVRIDGRVAEEPGAHLDAGQRRLRRKIVAAIEHKRAGGMKPAEAVVDYLRDAAFTVLNRFVALKMLEARELVQPCVSDGEASSGFNEFCGLAPGVRTPDGAGYRLYLECLFDELSTEVKVLFDRRDAPSALWPRRAAFLELLDILNAPALTDVWGEDETIGWVYQYFNGQDERRAMRDASQAPRNSRELAVRNQFFTPRYVVQFLTDNTLGRIWFEMRGGETALTDQCVYMVRQPDETWEPRAKKDPRDLRVLDPACGSGHFLLYAFDLLVTIYQEAWADPASPASEITGASLRADYPVLTDLRLAMPGLILAHNLHGVDIDPRCAQIAQLALWMRAQRAFREFGVARAARPLIRRSNIVIAEPMPGEQDLRDEFLRGLKEDRLEGLMRRALVIPADRPVHTNRAMADSLAALVETVWDEMTLAGEMGVLLKVERTLARGIAKARSQWEGDMPLFPISKFGFADEAAPFQRTDFVRKSGSGELDFWSKAERLVLRALEEYATTSRGAVFARRRMFADDAAHGLALVDLLSTTFDVVLMNPPFGDPSHGAKKQIFADYAKSKTELYACFLERSTELAENGLIGMLSARNGYFLSSMEGWRRSFILGQFSCHVFANLGEGVLDAAVECACVVVGKARGFVLCADAAPSGILPNGIASSPAEQLLLSIATMQKVPVAQLLGLPGATLAFQLPPQLRELFGSLPSIGDRGFVAKQGIGTSDNFRFLRLRWEVGASRTDLGWREYAKGSGFSPMYFRSNLMLRWAAAGSEVKAYSASLYGSWSKQITNTQYFGVRGLTYSSRTHRELAPALMEDGAAFDTKGCCIFPQHEASRHELAALTGFMNSRVFAALLRVGLSRVSAGLARQYTESLVMSMPVPDLEDDEISDVVERGIIIHRQITCHNECAEEFASEVWLSTIKNKTADRAIKDIVEREKATWHAQISIAAEIDDIAISRYFPNGVSEELLSYLDAQIGQVPRASRDLVAGGIWAIARSSPIFAITDDGMAEEGRVAATLLSLLFGAAIGHRSSAPTTHGIIVDDDGNPNDLVSRMHHILVGDTFKKVDYLVETAQRAHSTGATVRQYFRQEFFDRHIREYSSDKRKAPIYWQLSTPSASYSVWLYIHAFGKDTLFRVQNDYVAPKLAHERRELEGLLAEAGPSPTTAQSSTIEAQSTFVEELSAMLDEVKRVAPLWDPDLDDGVILNFAPLWRLVPQNRAWQKELRAAWASLVDGDYDWAHLSMRLWPERVVPKCAKDRSLAIAHDLEDVFWFEDAAGKWQPRPTPTRSLDDLIAERTSPAVKAALQSLLDAPDPVAASGRGRRKKS